MTIRKMKIEPMKFNFKGNNVRSKLIDGKPYFVAKDVALAIGYKDTTNAIKKHVKDKYKAGCQIATQFGTKEMTMISEPGIYQLAGQSRLPQAEPFQDWIFEEVLPSINHTGKYDVEQSQRVNSSNVADILSDPDNLLKLVTNYKDAKDEVERLKPKALIADAIEVSDKAILVRQMAKIISNNILQIGEKRLFSWLRDNGYLIRKRGSDRNMPTQRSIKLGIFKVQTSSFTHNSGKTEISYTPKITGKGQRYLINKFLQIQGNQIQLPGVLD